MPTSAPGLAQPREASQTRTKVRAIVIFVAFLTLLIAYLDRVNVSIIIADPQFKAEMGIANNPLAQGLLMSFFLFAYGGGMIVLGPLGDYLGPRKGTLFAIGSWSVALAMGAITRTINLLYASRFILGLGEALHMPMLNKYTKNWIPPLERGKANSGWGLGFMIGPAITLPLFTYLVGSLGWRKGFWFCAFAGLAVLPVIWWTKDKPGQHKSVNQAELDYILSGQKSELTQEKQAAASFWTNLRQLVTNLNYLLNVFTYWGSAVMWWGFAAWLPAYLKVARGFSWKQMGWLSSLPYVLGALATILVGYISDRYTPNRRAAYCAVGMAGCALSIYLGATLQNNLSAAYCMAMAMFFVGLHNPMSWTILQKIVPSNLVGTAAGLHNGTSQFIGAFVPAFMGYLISVSHGSYTAGLMFLVVAGCLSACTGTILALRKV
jgi:sugar phosphate permease